MVIEHIRLFLALQNEGFEKGRGVP